MIFDNSLRDFGPRGPRGVCYAENRLFRFLVRASRDLWAFLLGEGRFPRHSHLSPEDPMFSILAIPILIPGLVIRHSPSSRDDERAVIGLVVKTLLLILLLCLSAFINRL